MGLRIQLAKVRTPLKIHLSRTHRVRVTFHSLPGASRSCSCRAKILGFPVFSRKSLAFFITGGLGRQHWRTSSNNVGLTQNSVASFGQAEVENEPYCSEYGQLDPVQIPPAKDLADVTSKDVSERRACSRVA